MRTELGQQFFDGVDHCDRVGAGLPLNGENDCPRIVVPAGHFVVLNTVQHGTQSFEPNRVAVPIRHDQRTIIRCTRELAIGEDRVRLAPPAQCACWQIDISLADCLRDLVNAEAEIEADRLSLHLLANAGYDPQVAPALWRGVLGRQLDPGIFRSRIYASPEERARALQREIADFLAGGAPSWPGHLLAKR